MKIQNYRDFTQALLEIGFSIAGGNDEGIFSLVSHNWNETPPQDSPIRWHTGDPDTDPWEWRMRVLEERDDIACAKLFFRKSGYLTREWAPYFFAARNGGKTLDEAYTEGTVSRRAKQIHSLICDQVFLPAHAIRQLTVCGTDAAARKTEKSQMETALTQLQMDLHVTLCGSQQKLNRAGEEYGWASNVFCTAQTFWGEDIYEKAAALEREEAIEKIRARILKVNPNAQEKQILKFILG